MANEIKALTNQTARGIQQVNKNINQSSAVAIDITQNITQVNTETKVMSKGST